MYKRGKFLSDNDISLFKDYKDLFADAKEKPTEEEEKHTKEEEKHTEDSSSIESKKEILPHCAIEPQHPCLHAAAFLA